MAKIVIEDRIRASDIKKIYVLEVEDTNMVSHIPMLQSRERLTRYLANPLSFPRYRAK